MPTLPTTPEREEIKNPIKPHLQKMWDESEKEYGEESMAKKMLYQADIQEEYPSHTCIDEDKLQKWLEEHWMTKYECQQKLSAQATELLGEVEKLRKDIHPVTPTGFIQLPDRIAYNQALDDVKKLLTSLTSE